MIIAQGAEAIIHKENNKIIKERIKKSYRIPELDNKIRKLRTRSEAKILTKSKNSPNVLSVDESNFKIEMDFISGKTINDSISDLKDETFISLGKEIASLHDSDIVHGDLTTSNMIIKDNKIYFIDFGLASISNKVEDKAVDLHLLRQCFHSKHYQYENLFNLVLEGYKNSKNFKEILERMEKVSSRGRYKKKNGA